jgi:hypothetical protein
MRPAANAIALIVPLVLNAVFIVFSFLYTSLEEFFLKWQHFHMF